MRHSNEGHTIEENTVKFHARKIRLWDYELIFVLS
jgi:hypothetical protein